MGDVLIWGALALMVTLLVASVLLIFRWDRDRQAELERLERADVNALIEANPVSVWAPGTPPTVITAWEAHR
jgi:hypothetical protein